MGMRSVTLEEAVDGGDYHKLGSAIKMGKKVYPFVKNQFIFKFGFTKTRKQAGIYIIKDLISDLIYVGSSGDIGHRIRDHRTDINNGISDSEGLQKIVNINGIDNLECTIVLVEDKEVSLDIEQELIDRYHGEGRLLNSSLDARVNRKNKSHRHSSLDWGTEGIDEEDYVTLYHYSADKLKSLKTPRALNQIEKIDIKEHDRKLRGIRGNYVDHISFFLTPIPDNLASMYKDKHFIWRKDIPLYEYTVRVKRSDIDHWMIVATPKHLELLDSTPITLGAHEFFKRERRLDKKEGYVGESLESLGEVVSEFRDISNTMWEEQTSGELTDRDLRMYATRVVHLMLYPTDGEIDIESTTVRFLD